MRPDIVWPLVEADSGDEPAHRRLELDAKFHSTWVIDGDDIWAWQRCRTDFALKSDN